ncbi:hypothetical protein D9756_009288 [Leucocoprinus leucothites]|uniref:CCL2-like lectin domain-containing protein n=1 Tax=Leucocoprinus leucothites TaxID=201217 RepID=A0A8H5FV77_9AGAR|nr:hypothetical protein D9756_009288 [Leucoagaricus leucothites]
MPLISHISYNLTMSTPAPGTYYIVNRITDSSTGDNLAITFMGTNQYATLTHMSDSNDDQVWVIRDAGGTTQSISPANNPNLEVGWGSSGAIVLPRGNYVWNITEVESNIYTIQDGDRTAFWGATDVEEGENIRIAPGSPDDQGNHWFLISASPSSDTSAALVELVLSGVENRARDSDLQKLLPFSRMGSPYFKEDDDLLVSV